MGLAAALALIAGAGAPAPARAAGRGGRTGAEASAPVPWPAHWLVAAPTGWIVTAAVASPAGSAIDLIVAPASGRAPGRLERIALPSGRVEAARAVAAGATLAPLASQVAVLDYTGLHPWLRALAPRTLRPGRPVGLRNAAGVEWPAEVTSAASGAAWIGDGRTVRLVDLATGRTARRLRVPPGWAIGALAAAPAPRRLYTSVTDARGVNRVLALDPAPGRVEATSARLPALSAAALLPVATGVWVSYRTGMLGLTQLLRASRLQPAACPRMPATWPVPAPCRSVGMGDWPSVTGRTLWLAGAFGLSCNDPRTGAVRGGETLAGRSPLAGQVSRVVAQRGGLAYVETAAGIVALRPPSACLA